MNSIQINVAAQFFLNFSRNMHLKSYSAPKQPQMPTRRHRSGALPAYILKP
jgi:hypothetical protein